MITNIDEKKYRIPQIKLSYCSDAKASEKPIIRSSKDSAAIFLASYNDGEIEFQEYFKVLYLNRQNKALGIHTISMGGMETTIVDMKILFSGALLAKASNIIVCHNHPSGNLEPSHIDDSITRKIKLAGETLDITLLDHIIITDNGYYSYADEGRL